MYRMSPNPFILFHSDQSDPVGRNNLELGEYL